MTSPVWQSAATGALVVCAVVMTAVVVRREFFPATPDALSQPDARAIPGADTLAATGSLIGDPSAPVRIVEFSDFQCPFCARAADVIERVRSRNPDRVAVVYRHFPLDAIHPHARTAALAAECAGEQGRFAAYHDRLFALQDSIGRRAWDAFAGDAGVRDKERFRACMAEQRHAPAVERDARAAAALDLDVTPSLIIGGRLRTGVPTEEDLEQWIRDASP